MSAVPQIEWVAPKGIWVAAALDLLSVEVLEFFRELLERVYEQLLQHAYEQILTRAGVQLPALLVWLQLQPLFRLLRLLSWLITMPTYETQSMSEFASPHHFNLA